MEKFFVHKSKWSWKCLRVASAEAVTLSSQCGGDNVICLCWLYSASVPWAVAPKTGQVEINNSVYVGGFEQCAGKGKY